MYMFITYELIDVMTA